jgi:hypothetical protein
MLFQRVNRTDAEKVFVIVQNVASATITAGYPVVWDITSSVDGVRVSQPASATLSLFVGIANADIADSSYGLVQVYGYKSQAYVTNDTSIAVAAGNILIPVAAAWTLDYSAAGDGKSGFVYAAEAFATNTTPAAANKKVLIRAL